MTTPKPKAGRPIVTCVSLVLLVVVAAAVLFISMRSPLKDDIAWLLYVARRWMGGRELYVDLIEVNPPLIVWISALPLELAGLLHIGPQYIAMPLFVGGVLGCAAFSATLLRSQHGIFEHFSPVFALLGSALLILPAADLGQREHLLVAAFLPYLVLFAQGLERKHVRPVTQIIVAVLAGVGCALKPRYVLVFVVLECLALARGLRPWRLMPITAAMTFGGYALLVAVACPAYLQRAIPMALALYGATDVPFVNLLSDSALVIAGEILVVALLCVRRQGMPFSNLMATLIAFSLSSTAVCFIDGKDWYYHRLPATVTTVLALTLWCAVELSERRVRTKPALAAACLGIACFFAASVQRLRPEVIEAVVPTMTTVDRLEKIINDEHARTYIAFSEWIALGFPVVNNTGVTWASRFDSMWALKGEVWRAKLDPGSEKEWPISRWVAHDFIAGCPDIAVVDMRETTNYIRVLSSADPAFARAWSRYRPIASFDGLIVYKRQRGGCIDVWVAANATTNGKAR